jgi:hypothetical protein
LRCLAGSDGQADDRGKKELSHSDTSQRAFARL